MGARSIAWALKRGPHSFARVPIQPQARTIRQTRARLSTRSHQHSVLAVLHALAWVGNRRARSSQALARTRRTTQFSLARRRLALARQSVVKAASLHRRTLAQELTSRGVPLARGRWSQHRVGTQPRTCAHGHCLDLVPTTPACTTPTPHYHDVASERRRVMTLRPNPVTW